MSHSGPIGRHSILQSVGVAMTFGLVVMLIGPAIAAAAAPKIVETLADTYSPATLTVAAGTKVVFKNTSQLPHTATADDGSFDTGKIDAGATKSIVVKQTGRFAFYCLYHGAAGGVGQSGAITVTAAVGATSPPAKSSGGGTTPTITPPASDTSSVLPGPIEGLPLAAFAGAAVLAILLALALEGAGRAMRRRSQD